MKTVDINLRDISNVLEEDNCVVVAKGDDEHYAWYIDGQIIAVEKTEQYGIAVLLYETVAEYYDAVQDTWVLGEDAYISDFIQDKIDKLPEQMKIE